MNLLELLKNANVEEIVQEDPIKTYDVVDQEDRVKVYRKFIDNLPAAEEDSNEPGILLGRYVYDFIEKELSVDVGVYYLDEIDKKLQYIEHVYHVCKATPVEEMTDKEIEDFIESVKTTDPNESYLPSGYAFEFTEWEEILGWEVDPINVESVGINKFLSYVLFEMTFNGFEEMSQQERREDMEKRIEEFEELRKLPIEEQEKHFVRLDIDEEFEKLSEKYGFERVKKTDEEKEKERIEMNRQIAMNIQNEVFMLMDYYQRCASTHS